MRKRFQILALILLTVLINVSAPLSYGAFPQFESSPWTRENTYSEKTIQKLGFGLLNILTGWVSFFFEPYHDKNFFKGLAKGTLRTVTNTAGGALHTVTFPIPVDIPLPGGGVEFYREASA